MKRVMLFLLLSALVVSGCVFPANQHQTLNPLCWLWEKEVCVQYKEETHDILYRSFPYDFDKLQADYDKEYEYIFNRRKQRLTTQPPANLTGLALSGGGIRSANFQLGLLQALVKRPDPNDDQSKSLFEKIDYMSSVSGGSYIAGWMQAHLGARPEFDDRGWHVGTDDPAELLADTGDFVQHLRSHTGFLRGEGFWEGPKIIWDWLWRWPLSLAWDLGLHVKTVPQIGNTVHQVYPYRDRIADTYLRGTETAKLAPSVGDPDRHLSPYIIINGNLVNGGPRPGEKYSPWSPNYNFEFTRDFTGSDGLGYVKTKGFGWPVYDFEYKNDGSLPTRPTGVKVKVPDQVKIEYPTIASDPQDDGPNPKKDDPGEPLVRNQELLVRINETVKDIPIWDDERGEIVKVEVTVKHPCDVFPQIKPAKSKELRFKVKIREIGPPCFRLADAMTVSGAALDITSKFGEDIRADLARIAAVKAAAPLNLNWGYQTWNFAQVRRYEDDAQWIKEKDPLWDNVNMLTFNRFFLPTTNDPWIELTDGAFFDNLGAFSLLRRGVQHIIVSDATFDPNWNYHYLKRFRDLVEDHPKKQLRWCNPEDFPKDHEIVWYRKFWIQRPDNTFTVIHYLKPYAYNPNDLFSKNNKLDPSKDPSDPSQPQYPFIGEHPGPMSDLQIPKYLNAKHLVAEGDKRSVKWTKHVNAFAKSPDAKGFPQTTSWMQWYDMEEFEAYRRLGFLMGRAYLFDIEFNSEALKPPPSVSCAE